MADFNWEEKWEGKTGSDVLRALVDSSNLIQMIPIQF